MRKKLLTRICAFFAMSIFCVTPVMAQTASIGDTCKQTNASRVISIIHSANCGQQKKIVISLSMNCNISNLSEYLQNLIYAGCNKNPEINGGITIPGEDMDTNIPDQDTNLPDQDTTIPDQDTNLPDQDTTIPDQDTSLPDQDTSIPDQDTSTPDQDTNLPEQDTDMPDQDISIPDQDTTIPDLNVTAKPEITSTPETGNTTNTDFVSQVAALVNEERAKVGLSPVTLDTTLSKAAQVRAKEIVSYFSHTRPNGNAFSSAITEQGISFRGAGENIAYGQRTPQAVMNGWMNSTGHRANILNANFTKIGVGYYQYNGVNYWTQLFTY